MRAVYLWGAAALGLALACVLGLAGGRYLESEALILGHYPLRSVAPHTLTDTRAVKRGAHLARTLGCADCHGPDLRGGTVERGGADFLAPDLRALPSDYTSGDLARAVRFGLNPDGTSLWVMPASSYVYLSDADMDALIAYLRTLPSDFGAPRSRHYGLTAREAMVTGKVLPSADDALSTESSMDLGPYYQGGRYLARAACAECHGLDLDGSEDHSVPGLRVMGNYSLTQFFALMHDGRTRTGAHGPVMNRVAHARFRYFADYETRALYAYLVTQAWMQAVTIR